MAGEKYCTKCSSWKPLGDFSLRKASGDGRQSYCSDCLRKDKLARLEEKRKTSQQRVCIICSRKFTSQKKTRLYCDDCRQSMKNEIGSERSSYLNTQARGKPTERKLFEAAKRRAKRDGYPCTITLEDIFIPEFCPVLGMKLVAGNRKGPRPDAPSLDKIDPTLGYVPGNVQVISHKANSMKHCASRRELIAFAEWVLKEVVWHGTD